MGINFIDLFLGFINTVIGAVKAFIASGILEQIG